MGSYSSKRIQVLGVEIDNYTVRELMLQADEYLNDDYLNVITYITTELLIQAGKDEELKAFIEAADINVLADLAILDAIHSEDEQKRREIEKNEFATQFFKKLLRKRKRIYWLGNSETDKEAFMEHIDMCYKGLRVLGGFALQDFEGDIDLVLNEINASAPDVIVSTLSSPEQEHFIMEHRGKLNAKIWFGMGEKQLVSANGIATVGRIKSFIQKTLFQREVSKFNNENQENKK